jgi:hypothetical protein
MNVTIEKSYKNRLEYKKPAKVHQMNINYLRNIHYHIHLFIQCLQQVTFFEKIISQASLTKRYVAHLPHFF